MLFTIESNDARVERLRPWRRVFAIFPTYLGLKNGRHRYVWLSHYEASRTGPESELRRLNESDEATEIDLTPEY